MRTLLEDVLPRLGQTEEFDYKYSDLRGELKFTNGSSILLMDLADRPNDPEFEFLGSIEIAAAFIDEAGRVSEKAKNMVATRIRHKLNQFCTCGHPTAESKILRYEPITKSPIEWSCAKCGIATQGLEPKLLMSCNPTRNWCYNSFYKKHIDEKLEPYKAFIQSLVDDNNYVTKHYKLNLQRQDDLTKNRLLLGSWDYADELTIFNLDQINDMFDEDIDKDEDFTLDEKWEEQLMMSVDVSRLGKDSSVFIIWKGMDIIDIQELKKTRINDQLEFIEKLKVKYGIRNQKIVIDTDGVGGGLADFLPASVQINNGGKALNQENYFNIKTQMYFKLAEKINGGKIKIRKCSESIKTRLTQELQIIKRVNVDVDNKIKMTSKDDMKKAIGRSPDISDAMAYRMYWLLKNTDFNYSFAIC